MFTCKNFFNLTSLNYFSSYFVPNEIRFYEKFWRWLIGFKAFQIHSAYPLILVFFSQERNEVTGNHITPAYFFWIKCAWNKCHSFSQFTIYHFRVSERTFILSLYCVTFFHVTVQKKLFDILKLEIYCTEIKLCYKYTAIMFNLIRRFTISF